MFERTRSKDALLGLSLHLVLLELHFGLWKAKGKLFDFSEKSWPKAGDSNLPTSEGFFHFTLLSFQEGKKKKGEGGTSGRNKNIPKIIIVREKTGCLL